MTLSPAILKSIESLLATQERLRKERERRISKDDQLPLPGTKEDAYAAAIIRNKWLDD